MSRAYVSAKLRDDLGIKVLRDEVFMQTEAHTHYRKVDPHITVIPPFTIKEDKKSDVREVVDSFDLRGRHVEVNGLSVWKNIMEPYVVMLDVNIDLDPVRDELADMLNGHVERKWKPPVSPHITLFKTTGWWDDVPEEKKHSIQRQVLDRRVFKDTEIRALTLEVKD